MDQEHNDQTLLSKQQQSREQIFEDINKATQLYLSCPDPTEAAARRLRVLAGDARGQVEETVATMLTTNDSIPPGLNQTQQMRVGSQEKTRVHIMEELQQVTLQYLSCADPTEAAARRLRVIASENQGHLEETATGILAANVSSTLNQNTTSHHGIETQREHTLPPPSESNLPVASQNDQIHQLSDQGEESEAELPPRRRRVVPARYRKTASPNPLQGASSRKRNIPGMRPSPARKNKDKHSNGRLSSHKNSQLTSFEPLFKERCSGYNLRLYLTNACKEGLIVKSKICKQFTFPVSVKNSEIGLLTLEHELVVAAEPEHMCGYWMNIGGHFNKLGAEDGDGGA
ncbi:hypothetical protein DY000_02023062 [Brassica cretica]|uniref:Uncharacterized protein n=1 Tax=Brassica cretica TaxID=69181 RepID=A0ABQ7E135_BRACR|nr:hypothetical protein DY000_02023062 [Brassica cretica]